MFQTSSRDSSFSTSSEAEDENLKTSTKRQQLLDRLKTTPISLLKGSSFIIQTIKSQKQAVQLSAGKSRPGDTELQHLLAKQQKILVQLNEENVELIAQLEVLRKHDQANCSTINKLTRTYDE